MKRFGALATALDETTRISVKTAQLAQYFKSAPEADRVWAVALFSGRRPKRVVTMTQLRSWCAEQAQLPLWLIEESYSVVGDLAETIALCLPPAKTRCDDPLSKIITDLIALRSADEEQRKAHILYRWSSLDPAGRFVFNKLLTGGFRLGVRQKLMTKALAEATGYDAELLAYQLMGDWDPAKTTWQDLISGSSQGAITRPYPFFLCHALSGDPSDLGQPDDWQAEWKWDGIRAQLVKRGASLALWSRGEELITQSYPEFAPLAETLSDGTVLDGELLVWDKNGETPASFNALQKRLGRKKPSAKLQDAYPACLYVYDMLEDNGQDLRALDLAGRMKRLDHFFDRHPALPALKRAPSLAFKSWAELEAIRQRARESQAEGVMLKRIRSAYGVGRKKGDWCKWKLDPLTIDAVMIYAQAGHGRRANLFTDFTFAVWDGQALVPIAKAYSGLTDAEFSQITAWVRKNTRERFGPVRSVTPTHLFEIAFEGLQASSRHKSGIALRFPRMARWRKDKPISEANTLDDLRQMLANYG